jgi:hypothetical protein
LAAIHMHTIVPLLVPFGVVYPRGFPPQYHLDVCRTIISNSLNPFFKFSNLPSSTNMQLTKITKPITNGIPFGGHADFFSAPGLTA